MPKDDQRQQGELKVYDPIKGFGFISRAEGKDVFAFYADFESTSTDAAAVAGSIVEFCVEKTPKGLKAKHIVIVS